ncbi:MAG: hypothetical protein ACE5JI_01895 [Acidobacteriota bacterium]
MEKLDRLGWAAGTAFVAHGVRVGIRVNEPAVLSRVDEILPLGSRPARSPLVDHLYSLRSGGADPKRGVLRFNLLYSDAAVRVARSMDIEAVLQALETHLELLVAAAARNRLFVHAGVVGWRDQAIVLAGPTFSGKTTLVTALIRAGATYYSDEYAVLDGRGRVHPYPKPLSIRNDGCPRSQTCPVEALGGRAGRKPLPVGLVVTSEYKSGSRWRPRLLSPAQGVLALLSNTVSARSRPRFAMATLKKIARRVPVLKGVRGEAEEMIEALLTRLEGKAA